MKTSSRGYNGLWEAALAASQSGPHRKTRTNLSPNAKLVMIVEDDQRARRMLARTVLAEFEDAVVIQAENGRDALDKLAEIRIRYLCDPQLIITDLDMPVMDGWKLIRKLRQDYEDRGANMGIPVVVMSGTSGGKGLAFYRRSVHGGKAGYTPLVAIAKMDCDDQDEYVGVGAEGLITWLRHFLNGDGRSAKAARMADRLRS